MVSDFPREVTIADVGDVQWHPVFVVSMGDWEVPNMLRMLSVGINIGIKRPWINLGGQRHLSLSCQGTIW